MQRREGNNNIHRKDEIDDLVVIPQIERCVTDILRYHCFDPKESYREAMLTNFQGLSVDKAIDSQR